MTGGVALVSHRIGLFFVPDKVSSDKTSCLISFSRTDKIFWRSSGEIVSLFFDFHSSLSQTSTSFF
jgi:hypothetical protein